MSEGSEGGGGSEGETQQIEEKDGERGLGNKQEMEEEIENEKEDSGKDQKSSHQDPFTDLEHQCLNNPPKITESKRFESSPIDFIDEETVLWKALGGTFDFILTYNSYYDALGVVLGARGFQEVGISMVHL